MFRFGLVLVGRRSQNVVFGSEIASESSLSLFLAGKTKPASTGRSLVFGFRTGHKLKLTQIFQTEINKFISAI